MQLADSVYDQLPEESFLRAMEREELGDLLRFATTKTLRANQTLFELGDEGDSMMIVLAGQLKICVFSAQGKEVVLDYFGVGGIIGEVAVLDGGPRAASAMATEKTELLVLHRRDLLPFLRTHLDIAIKVIGTLCDRLRRTNALVEANATLAMAPKLARGLLLLASEHGSTAGEGAPISLRIKQSDLANYVSLSRENVNRQLQEWVDEGFVELSRGRISVIDQESLGDIAEDMW